MRTVTERFGRPSHTSGDVRPRTPAAGAPAVVISYLFIKSGGLSSVRQPPSESDPKDLRAQQREFARERHVDWYNSLPPERRNQVDKKVAKRRVEKWRKKGLP